MYSNTTQIDHRAAFSDGDVSTASPAKVIVKCFDRLDADLERALGSLERGEHEATNALLGHAQDLLGEMAGMLDLDAWDHAGSLLAVYDYVLRLLAGANMLKAPAMVAEARRLISEIGDGFRAAADQTPPTGVTTGATTAAGATASPFGGDGVAGAERPARPQGFSVLA